MNETTAIVPSFFFNAVLSLGLEFPYPPPPYLPNAFFVIVVPILNNHKDNLDLSSRGCF